MPCSLASPPLLSSLRTIPYRSFMECPVCLTLPEGEVHQCNEVQRAFPKNPHPNPNPILDPNTSPYEPLPPRGTAIVSTVGFALPLAAAPSAACRYPDATATGQPSGRSPP